jgi:hypothetical protein
VKTGARHALATTVVLAVSCADPTRPCGCSLPDPIGVLRGTVIDMAGRPIGLAMIMVGAVPGSPCGSNPRIYVEARSGADGRFVARYWSNFCGDSLYQAWAEPLPGSPWLASTPVTFAPRTSLNTVRDTSVVELVLRDPP